MTTGSIFHSVHKYYQLEGIPAYPSPFVPVDYLILEWLDTNDLNRFRREKYFISRLEQERAGLEYSIVGTGYKGEVVQREMWDGVLFHEGRTQIEQRALDFQSWLENMAEKGRNLVETARKGGKQFAYKEAYKNDDFGEIIVVVNSGDKFVQASDLYMGFPLEFEYHVDTELFRIIRKNEMK